MTGLGRSLSLTGVLLFLLAVPTASHAAFVARSGSDVFFFGDPGETNNVAVGFTSGSPGEHTFSDPLNPIDTSPDDGTANECVNVTPTTASCPSQAGDNLLIDLADQNDSAITTSPFGLSICGGGGNDVLTGGDEVDFLLGEGDSDTIDGGGGNDIVITERFVCTNQTAPPAQNDVDGGDGDDALIGGLGEDSLSGGDGDDSLLGARVDDGVDGDDDDELSGGDGDDNLVGHDGADALDGGNGADRLVGGNGDDGLLGGPGDDQLGVTVNQSFNSGQQRVTTTDPGKDHLDGGAGDDLLNGGPGGSVLNFGLQGSIEAFETTSPNGPDDLIGGPGRDTVTYVNLALPVRATPDDVADDGSSGEGDNIRRDNEVLIGGSLGDTLIGGPASDTIDGGKGGDSIEGAGGDDTLAGGADDGGADNIAGGEGADSLEGGPGDDSLNGQAGTDGVDGGGGADAAGGGDGADRVSGGAGLDVVTGGPGDDRLLGAADGLIGADGADALSGDDGNDGLDGGPDDDTLAGGRGADVMTGADGRDTADYRGAEGPVTAKLDGAPGDGTRRENDHIRADVENLRGGRGQDTFTGSPGANVIEGGGGEDYVDGARGADTLNGGDGPDAVRSRDSSDDRVACGRSRDFAIADGGDRVRGNCERVDRGGRRRPALGRSMLVRPANGTLALRVAGMHRFIPLKDSLRLPLRSSIDARRGAVRVTTQGSLSSGTFSTGRFSVRQRRRRHAQTELRLEGGSFRRCRGTRVVRRLRAHGRGRFRTTGRRSSTATRSGRWVVEDRCDGTLTRVLRGRARVLDHGRARAVTLRAGRSYLARAR